MMLCLLGPTAHKIRGCIDVDVWGHKNMSPGHVHQRHKKGEGKRRKRKDPPSKKVSSHKWSILNPLLPHISMHILHTVLSTFPRVLTRRICSAIMGFFSWWSSPLFSWPWCLISGWCCKEKLDISHSWGKGLNLSLERRSTIYCVKYVERLWNWLRASREQQTKGIKRGKVEVSSVAPTSHPSVQHFPSWLAHSHSDLLPNVVWTRSVTIKRYSKIEINDCNRHESVHRSQKKIKIVIAKLYKINDQWLAKSVSVRLKWWKASKLAESMLPNWNKNNSLITLFNLSRRPKWT